MSFKGERANSFTSFSPKISKPIQVEQLKNIGSFSTEFENLEDDPIFKKLSDYISSSNECENCKKNFGLLNRKKNCAFCGKALCKSHIAKKRQDPNNSEKFAKICETCEEKYLNKIIWEDFSRKKRKKEEENRQFENQFNEIKAELAAKQNEYNKLNSLKEENEKNFQERIQIITKNLNKKKKMTEKLEEENKELNEQDIEINKKTKEETVKGVELQNELEILKEQYETVCKELTTVENEIKRLNTLINDTEDRLTSFKINKKNNNIPNFEENYNFSLMSNGEGSIIITSSINKYRKSLDQPVEGAKSCCELF